jgi:hypothetical protein
VTTTKTGSNERWIKANSKKMSLIVGKDSNTVIIGTDVARKKHWARSTLQIQ